MSPNSQTLMQNTKNPPELLIIIMSPNSQTLMQNTKIPPELLIILIPPNSQQPSLKEISSCTITIPFCFMITLLFFNTSPSYPSYMFIDKQNLKPT